MNLRAGSIVVLFALAACSTVAPKVTNPAMATATPGRYAVTVERGKHLGFDSLPLNIFVDGKVVAQVDGGRAVTLYLTEGRHLIGIESGRRTKAGPSDEIAVDVSASHSPILRTNVYAMGYGGWKIERVK